MRFLLSTATLTLQTCQQLLSFFVELLSVVNPLGFHNLLHLVNKLCVYNLLHLNWHFHYFLNLDDHFNRNLPLDDPLYNHLKRNLDNLLNFNDSFNFHYSLNLNYPLHLHYLLNYPFYLYFHYPFNLQRNFHSLHHFNKLHNFHWDFFDPFHYDFNRPINIDNFLYYCLHLHYPLYFNYPLYLDWYFYYSFDRHFHLDLFFDFSPYYPLCLNRNLDDDLLLKRNLYDFVDNFLVLTLFLILFKFLLENRVQMMWFEILHQYLILILDVVMPNLQALHLFLNTLVFLPQSRDLPLLCLYHLVTLFGSITTFDPCDLVAILIELECEIVVLVIGGTLG